MVKSLCVADVYEDTKDFPNCIMPPWIYDILNSKVFPAFFDIGEAKTLEELLELVEGVEYHGSVIWRFKYRGKIGYAYGSVVKRDNGKYFPDLGMIDEAAFTKDDYNYVVENNIPITFLVRTEKWLGVKGE